MSRKREDIRVEGLDELKNALKALPAKMRGRVLRESDKGDGE